MPLTFHHRTLPNGLDVLAEVNPDAHSFAAGVFVKAGARDEPKGVNGVSHFLEHMMFKGSDRYGWEDMNRVFDEMGARYNASTSSETTMYYAAVLPEFTGRAIEHLSHLLNPAIRQADFDTEKNVILEEIAMYLDDPGHRLYEAASQAYFGDHPLALSILGPAESIKAMTRDAMADYFRQRYGPGNMVLVATGRLDFDEVCDLAEQHFGDRKRVDVKRDYPAVTPPAKTESLTDPKLNRQYTLGLTPGPDAQDDCRFAARVLGDVVGDDDGSRLYWALVDNAIAEDADFGFYPHDRAGSFYVSLTTDPERSKKALDIALAELERVKADLDADEVERAKNKLASGLVLSGERPTGRMRAIGSQWLYTGRYRPLEEDMRSLLAVTPESLKALMAEFPFDPMTVVTLGPK